MSRSNAFTDMPAAGLGRMYIQMLAIFSSKWMTLLKISGIPILLFYVPYHFVRLPLCQVMPIVFMSFFTFLPISFAQYDYYLPVAAKAAAWDHSHPLLIFHLAKVLFVPILGVTIVPFLLIISIIHGATIRVAAEMYAGLRSPDQLLHCLMDCWRHKWKITFVSLIVLAPNLIGAMILYLDIPTLLMRAGFRSVLIAWWTPLLLKVVFHVMLALTCAGMAASTPMIVVEKKSVVEAIKSSWYLCRTSFLFVFTSIFSWFVLHTLVWILPNSQYSTVIQSTAYLLESFTPVPVGFGNIVMSYAIRGVCIWFALLLQCLTAIICLVVYASLRIRKQGLTREQLVQFLSNET